MVSWLLVMEVQAGLEHTGSIAKLSRNSDQLANIITSSGASYCVQTAIIEDNAAIP